MSQTSRSKVTCNERIQLSKRLSVCRVAAAGLCHSRALSLIKMTTASRRTPTFACPQFAFALCLPDR